MMVLTLAEQEYLIKALHEKLIRHSFTWPVTRFVEDNFAEITVPEILEPAKGSNIVLRGSSIQLLAVLESGDVDYAFEYESVIAQHELLSVPLPDSINLGSQAYQDLYSEVQVKLDFQRFSTVKPVFVGAPIGYGITIPSNAPAPRLAEKFIAFLLSDEGRAVMKSAHHPLVDSIECSNPEKVPLQLQVFCQSGN